MKLSALSLFTFITAIIFSGCTKDAIVNKVPVSNAGPDQTITLPADATLTGSGADADGQVVAYLWSQVSGPDASMIMNPGSASTTVNFSKDGTYVFQLMVTDDDGATGVDTVTIIVNPSPEKTLTLQPANNPNEKLLTIIGGVDYSGSGDEYTIDAWTVNSSPYYAREVFSFDLSTIPSTSQIVSAHLYLYSNTPPLNGNFVDANFGTDNTLYLQQITSSWTTASVNWANQPSVATSNQVEIPHTPLSVLDVNVDVTSMVGSMISANANYGFLLRLKNETIYTSRMFVSSTNAAKADKHPKLVVVYK